MAKFSERSLRRLSTCHEDLQKVMHEVIKQIDISIISGHRGEEEQNELVRLNRSTLRYPKSKHNASPSNAVDVAPWVPGIGLIVQNESTLAYMAGIVMATAHNMGVKLRWGGDWNRDQYTGNESFVDMFHFELDE